MRELDLLLTGHLDRHGAALDAGELHVFKRLLEQADIDLYHWFTGRERAVDADFAALVSRILDERGAHPRALAP